MTKKIKTENNMSSSGLTRGSRNKDLCADWMPDQVGHDRKEEQGRSMVEMLGTLAIIGVLSVGGIAGYTYGMNKYYANELLAGASARAVIVASQLASGREASLSEFDKMKDTAGGEFDNENIAKFSDGFGIKVSKVKKAVCENLIKDTEGTDIGIETEAGGEVTCGDENTFFITFDSLGISGGELSTKPSDLTPSECLEKGGVWCDAGCNPAGYTCQCPTAYNPKNYEITGAYGKDGETCCDLEFGYAYDEGAKAYSAVDAVNCGCPMADDTEGQTVQGILGNDGETCCDPNYGYSYQQEYRMYAETDIENCGCPKDTYGGEYFFVGSNFDDCYACGTNDDPRYIGGYGYCIKCSVYEPDEFYKQPYKEGELDRCNQ